MKSIFFAGLSLVVLSAFAAETSTPVSTAEKRQAALAKRKAAGMRSYGGEIIDRRGQKGELTVVNAQKAIEEPFVSACVCTFADELKIAAKVENGSFDLAAPAVKGPATLFVVDAPQYPISLVAVEARWAVVNVAKLKSEKRPFFEARVRKAFYRTAAQLCGAFSNQYETNLFSGAFDAEGLDQIVATEFPYEYKFRFAKYLPQMGIVPYKVSHYDRAVREGWAPAPTNEFQKAIWEKIRATPKNPMKIEFDPKKGR